MNHLDIIHVTWVDSQASSDWQTIDDMDDKLELSHTVGAFVKETKDAIVVSLSYDPQTEHFNCTKHIPICSIADLRLLLRVPLPNG